MKPLSHIFPVILFFSLWLSNPLDAASFYWNTEFRLTGSLENESSSWQLQFGYEPNEDTWGLKYMEGGGVLGNCIIFSVEKSTLGKRKLSVETMDIWRGATLLTATMGDVISSSAVSDSSRVMIRNWDWTQNASITYKGKEVTSIYLGLEAEVEGWNHFIYGWIELIADDYTLTLGNTFVDLSGNPVTVGKGPPAVPEPATGALALLGAALLFRRRIRQQRSFWFF